MSELTDQDCHAIDGQLHLESLTTLAFMKRHIDINEYEFHRDERLRNIVAQLAKCKPDRERIKAEYVRFNHKLIAITARVNATGEYAELEAAEEEFFDAIIALFEEEKE